MEELGHWSVLWDAQSILKSAEFDYVSDLCCREEILRRHGAARVASFTMSSSGPLLLQEAQIEEGNGHSLLVQIPRAKAVITCASDQPGIGMAAALQPQSGTFFQPQPDCGIPCCNVCASCQITSSPLHSVNINHSRWDCQEWFMVHLHNQSTVIEICSWKVWHCWCFFPESNWFSVCGSIFPLHNYFKCSFFGWSCHLLLHYISQNPNSDLII